MVGVHRKFFYTTNSTLLELNLINCTLNKHIGRFIKLDEKVTVPFIPLLYDALDLNALGGSRIVFLWTKGAPPALHHHVVNLFKNDHNAQILMTHLKENEVGIDYTRKLSGAIARKGGSMMLYFYVNTNFKKKSIRG